MTSDNPPPLDITKMTSDNPSHILQVDVVFNLATIFTMAALIMYSIIIPSNPDEVNSFLKFTVFISFLLSSSANRLSIFVNIILATLRSIHICRPFYVVSKRGIMYATVACLVFWVAISTGEIHAICNHIIEKYWGIYRTSPKFSADSSKQGLYMWYFVFTHLSGYFLGVVTLGSMDMGPLWSNHDEAEEVLVFVCAAITFIFPAMVSMITTAIQFVWLRAGKDREKNRNITVTIILLTISFCLCNVLSLVITVVVCYTPLLRGSDYPKYERRDDVIRMFYKIMFTCQTLLPLTSATISPLILILRGGSLRKYVRYLMVCKIRPITSPFWSSLSANNPIGIMLQNMGARSTDNI